MMEMRKAPAAALCIACMILMAGCPNTTPVDRPDQTPVPTVDLPFTMIPGSVTVVDAGSHFEVTLDYDTGASPMAIGALLGRAILATPSCSSYTALVDSYIFDSLNLMAGGNEALRESLYARGISATYALEIPEDYRDEIEGLAWYLCDTTRDSLNDGMLSKDEVFLLQLILDLGKSSQCSAVSVFGNRSATGSTITGRVLDWYSGESAQLPRIQAVTTIKRAGKSVVLVGYLGLLSGITVANDDGLFAAILESSVPETLTTADKRSYAMDLRYAMETYSTLQGVTDFMKGNPYVSGHLVFLSDSEKSQVLENDLETGHRRDLRIAGSSLNADIAWGIDEAVACVNSFVLNGNYDNHTVNNYNWRRWDYIRNSLAAAPTTLDGAGIKAIVSDTDGGTPGDMALGYLYNETTQQIVVIEPGSPSMEVFFRPEDGILPDVPEFETIPISF